MSTSSIPPFDVVDASGRRRRVHPAGETDTVADLAAALGYRHELPTTIGGMAVAADRLLTSVEALVAGAEVSFEEPADVACPSHARRGIDGAAGLEFAVVTGPCCRSWTPLPVGRHGIGRSQHATIRLADDLVELHHALAEVDSNGAITLTQLTGRLSMSLARGPERASDPRSTRPATTPLTRCDPVRRSEWVQPGDSLMVGSSRIEIRRRQSDERPPGQGGSPATSSTDRSGTVSSRAGDPWHLEVRRGPAEVPPARTGAILRAAGVPRLDLPAGTALVGAIVAFLGALMIAGLLRQTMFAVFALVGAFASAATWAVGALSVLRRRRNARRVRALDLRRFSTQIDDHHRSALVEHLRRHPHVVDALDELHGERSKVWHRRLDVDGGSDGVIRGAIEVVIGQGDWRVEPPVDASGGDGEVTTDEMAMIEAASVLRDVPVPVCLVPDGVMAIRGEAERVRSLMRSIVVQIATWFGPADIRVVVVGDPAAWDWVRWLPHARTHRGDVSVFAPSELDRLGDVSADRIGPGRPERDDVGAVSTILLIDDPTLLTVRTGPLRRFMTSSRAATIVAVDPSATVPNVCRRTLGVSSSGGGAWVGERSGTNEFERVCVAGLDEATACRAARALAPLIDPEDSDLSLMRIPDELTLTALGARAHCSDADDIVARWTAAGTDPALRAPIGVSADGIVEVDLVVDGPHALVAGTTGAGKSELLRTLVVSLASRVDPKHLNFVLVDYKGGATFDSCVDLPHTVGMVTDLDDGLAERALVSLDAELDHRERLLRSAPAGDLTEYRALPGREPIARLVVIIDEFATLAHELPDFLSALVAVAQRGRSLGVHVILATQRPAGVVTDDIRANTDLRIALRVNDATEARDVVGDDLPATFTKTTPGRAMMRLAGDDRIVFQAARCTGPVPRSTRRLHVTDPFDRDPSVDAESSGVDLGRTELSTAVEAIRRAAAALSIAPPRRPWLDPLGPTLGQEVVDTVVADQRSNRGDLCESPTVHDAIGVVDDPANQRRVPLRWDRASGNLLLCGSLGSGRTSTVVSLVAALCRTAPPDRRHVYVIDGLGDRLLDGLASVAHCGAVVRVSESERVDRLLRRLDSEIGRRSAVSDDSEEGPEVVLIVDGLGELRRSLDAVERLATLAMLDRILDAGPPVGVTSCLTLDASGTAASLSVAERWILRLDDPATARAAGLRGPRAPGAHPGRLRVASTGLEAQVAVGAAGLAELPSRPHPLGPPELIVLPAEVDLGTLTRSHVESDGGRRVRHLVVALGSDDLEPTALRVPDGDHIFIGGGARTGMSTTLDCVARAWADCQSDIAVHRWSGSVVDLRARFEEERDGRATLVVIDNADRVHDVDGLFAEVIRGDHPNVTLAVAARVDAVRGAYGHWTRDVARGRCGFVMTGPGEVDGDLLGALLPRRTSVPHRPGLAWLIDGRGHRLVQVAGRMRV